MKSKTIWHPMKKMREKRETLETWTCINTLRKYIFLKPFLTTFHWRLLVNFKSENGFAFCIFVKYVLLYCSNYIWYDFQIHGFQTFFNWNFCFQKFLPMNENFDRHKEKLERKNEWMKERKLIKMKLKSTYVWVKFFGPIPIVESCSFNHL